MAHGLQQQAVFERPHSGLALLQCAAIGRAGPVPAVSAAFVLCAHGPDILPGLCHGFFKEGLHFCQTFIVIGTILIHKGRILGNGIAFGLVTPIMSTLFYGSELSITLMQSQVGGVSNVAVLVIIGIPLLKIMAARNARNSNLSKE